MTDDNKKLNDNEGDYDKKIIGKTCFELKLIAMYEIIQMNLYLLLIIL